MRININHLKEMKQKQEKIVMLTAYDYSTARIVNECSIPLILVGDSLGMVVLGYDSTIPVTMDDMLHHTKAVSRGASQSLIVGDMPFMSYHINTEQAMHNASRLIQEGGAQAVKIEGGRNICTTIESIVNAGIPVMGHIGLTPQYMHQLGGFRAQGKSLPVAINLYNDALALEQAGAFAIVIEAVPERLATYISQKLGIPTIGIGAGDGCDGQVQVINDILGSFSDFVPKHAKQYANLSKKISQAVKTYRDEVTGKLFPSREHGIAMSDEVFSEFLKAVE